MPKEPVFYILEGPDKAGKSTFAMKLIEGHKRARISHTGPPKKGDLFRAYLKASQKAAKEYLKGRTIVLDRHYLGEQVYGPIFRGGSRLSMWDQRRLELFLNTYGARQLHVSEVWQVMEKRYKTQKPPDKLLRKFPVKKALGVLWDIRAKYVEIFKTSGIQSMDARSTMPQELVDGHSWVDRWPKVRDYFKHIKGGGIGTLTPQFLIVGDVRNKRTSKGLPYPFFTDSGSSRWLGEVLEDAYAPWALIHITNSRKDDGRFFTKKELAFLCPGAIICLGENATKRVRRCLPEDKKYPEIYSLPHPQYWKRFQSANRNGYIRMLRQIFHGGSLDHL